MAADNFVHLINDETLTSGTATPTTPGVLPAKAHRCVLFSSVGVVSGTTPSYTVLLQHSPDGNTWFNAAAALTAITASSASEAQHILTAISTDYLCLFQYVRGVYTITGTNPVFNNVKLRLYWERSDV